MKTIFFILCMISSFTLFADSGEVTEIKCHELATHKLVNEKINSSLNLVNGSLSDVESAQN